MFSFSSIKTFIYYFLYFGNIINPIMSLFGIDATVIFDFVLPPQIWCLLFIAVFVGLRFQQQLLIKISEFPLLGLLTFSYVSPISFSVPQMITICNWVGQKLGLLSTGEARPELNDLPVCSERTPLFHDLHKYRSYGSMGTSPRIIREEIPDCDAEEKIGFIPFDDEIEIVVC